MNSLDFSNLIPQPRSIWKRTAFLLLFAALGITHAQTLHTGGSYVPRHPPAGHPSLGCGDFDYGPQAIGPLDYRVTPDEVINFVESRHFTENVERLIKGERGTVAGDIAYTLRAFPNNPRALRSAAELTRRNAGRMPPDLGFTVACWFDRAIAFRPDDGQVRVLWAFELLRAKDTRAALEQTKIAETLTKDSPALHYNVGLLFFELKEYDRSLANAKIAYGQGFNLPGLRDKLTKAGKWKD